MKPVLLYDFFKRLADEGIDLKGCMICTEGKDFRHIFDGLSEDRVMVKHGKNHEDRGSMGEYIRVAGLSISPLVTKGDRNSYRNNSISVSFVYE
jgi:hypothetical protein